MILLPAGDCAVVAQFEKKISPEVNAKVSALNSAVENAHIPGVTETLPTYAALLIYYDPLVITYDEICEKLKALSDIASASSKSAYIYSIPVCYGGEFGEDLDSVAEYAKITPDEVIRRHSAKPYLIYMLGFLPGFSYLGGLDESIACPRLSSPRQRIEPGSVGIGGSQTGIYPIASPGGWRMIGRTPVRTYDPRKEDPILYRAGDYIRFIPIDRTEYEKIASEVEAGTYVCKREAVK